MKHNCPRCGLRRLIKPERASVANPHRLCSDCLLVEPTWPIVVRIGARGRPKTARCGTDSGYHRHIKRDRTPPCEPCLDAHAEASRVSRERMREVAA